MSEVVPTEDQEQMAFVEWLELNHIPHFHVNNEMWTKSWKQKTRSKKMGTKSGVPDLFLVFDGKTICIEMKRQKGGTVSDNQKYWGYILGLGGIKVYCCHGCDEAIETVQKLMKSGTIKKIATSVIESLTSYPPLERLVKIVRKSKKTANKSEKTEKSENSDLPY